jgi:uncharacterized protein YhaN
MSLLFQAVKSELETREELWRGSNDLVMRTSNVIERVAYLEEYADRTEPIPFIGDDLVTSFDDERTTQGLKALAATGGHIQPILFTHHKRVVELAQAELGTSLTLLPWPRLLLSSLFGVMFQNYLA